MRAGDASEAARLYRAAFRCTPTPCTLLDAELRVVDVNPAFTAATGRAGADLVGLTLDEAFPDDPDGDGTGLASAVRASLERARDTGVTDRLDGLRYDVLLDGRFRTRYWDVANVPVVDDDGVLVGLLNRVDDVTRRVEEELARGIAQDRASRLQEQVAAAQADLLARAAELQRLNDRLRSSSDHDRSVAQALQSAMLTTMPRAHRFELAARYLTATGTEQVGGDWYDAIVRPDGSVVLVIGDVIGHDIDAAGLMGQLRSMVRAFAWDHGEPPSHIVSLLDRAMRDLGVETLATLVVLAVTPVDDDGGFRLWWSNAGHPPPLLARPDGAVVTLEGAVDPLLGVHPEVARGDHEADAPEGGLLLLYTDGLIETRTEDLEHGLDRLQASLAAHRDRPAGEVLDAVVGDLVGDHPADDVAVIAVRVLAR